MGSWCAGWGGCGCESVLGKSLTPCWRWEFALKLGKAALEPPPNWSPTGNASGGLNSLGTGSDFDVSARCLGSAISYFPA